MTWEPIYRTILDDFGYPRAADEDARDLLAGLVTASTVIRLADLTRVFAGRDIVVLGAGASLASWLDADARRETRPVIVSDGAVASALDAGIVPALIVTDLDGDARRQCDANARGIPLAVHAHGDNTDALEEWVPAMRGPVLPTTQAEPVGSIVNAGGFTDGDRAVFIAAEARAARVFLAGFDAEPGPYKAPSSIKARKLAWMTRLLPLAGVPLEDAAFNASTEAHASRRAPN